MAIPKKKKWILVGAAVLLLAGVAFAVKRNHSKEWIKVKRGPLVQAIYGLGTLTAEREFALKPAIAGTIDRVFVTEGDEVVSGAPLVKLMESPIYRAPFAGTVVAVPFQAGENVFPQIPILNLVDLSKQYLSLTAEQASAILIRKDQRVRIAFESVPNQFFSGKVRSIVPRQGQFAVWIQPESLPKGILPGMTADCAIQIDERANVTQLPTRALNPSGVLGRTSQGELKKFSPKTGIQQSEWIEWTDADASIVEVQAVTP